MKPEISDTELLLKLNNNDKGYIFRKATLSELLKIINKKSPNIKSLESYIPISDDIFKQFETEIAFNQELYNILYTPISKQPKYKYLLEDFEGNYRIGNRIISKKDLTLMNIISVTITDDFAYSYFLKDDKNNNFIGFIAYFKYFADINIIDAIKVFKFDKNGDVGWDVRKLVKELIKINKEVHWRAHKDNTKAVQSYKTFVTSLKHPYVAKIEEDKDNINIINFTVINTKL